MVFQKPQTSGPEMAGKVEDTIAQTYFEKGLVCTGADHYREMDRQ